MLSIVLATSLLAAPFTPKTPNLPNFDGNIHADYTIDQKIELLLWRTDTLLMLMRNDSSNRDVLFQEIDNIYQLISEMKLEKR